MIKLRLTRSLLCLLTAVLVCGWAGKHVRAELGASLLERSARLFELAPHWQHGEPRALYLNGARMIIASGISEQPQAALLDHFQAMCRRHTAGIHAVMSGRNATSELPSLLDGVLRVEGDGAGLVACLALGEDPLGIAALVERLEHLAETGDLSALGGLRVVRVQPRGDGSFFVAAWNDGPVVLDAMFPVQGDSPGIDFRGVPRPEHATRTLSAWQEGGEAAANLYSVPEGADVAFSTYERMLVRASWQIDDGARLLAGDPRYGALFSRAGKTLVVHVETHEDGSWVSVLPGNLGSGFVPAGP
jgi:hypothetical protein